MTFTTFLLYFFISHFVYSLFIGVANAGIYYVRLVLFKRKLKNGTLILQKQESYEDESWH